MANEFNGLDKIWNRRLSDGFLACETDPAWLKAVGYGKRKYSNIDNYTQLRRATELWGPYGEAWGLRDLQWDRFEAPDTAYLALNAVFWYPDGSFPIANEIDMWHKGKDGQPVHNNEFYKKLLTETRSKALSLVGFNADVYMGKHDGARHTGTPDAKGTPPKQRPREDFRDKDVGGKALDHEPATPDMIQTMMKLIERLKPGEKPFGPLCHAIKEVLPGWSPPERGLSGLAWREAMCEGLTAVDCRKAFRVIQGVPAAPEPDVQA